MGDSPYQYPVAIKWNEGLSNLRQVENKLLQHFQSKNKSNGGECEIQDLDCSRGYILVHFRDERVSPKTAIIMGDSPYQYPVAIKWNEGLSNLRQVENKLLQHFQSTNKSNGGECEIQDLDCSRGYILVHFRDERVSPKTAIIMGDSPYQYPVAIKWNEGLSNLRQVENKLLQHFQSTNKSNGGECEIQDLDCSRGYILVHYRDERVRDQVLQKKTHELQLPGDMKLKLDVSSVDVVTGSKTQEASAKPVKDELIQSSAVKISNVVLIENVQDSCPSEMLTLLIEIISDKNDDTDFYLERIHEIQSAVITFTSNIGPESFVDSALAIFDAFGLNSGIKVNWDKTHLLAMTPGGSWYAITNLIFSIYIIDAYTENQEKVLKISPVLYSVHGHIWDRQTSPDVFSFIEKFSKHRLVNQQKLTAKCLGETRSIRAEGLPPNTEEDHLMLYFESSKIGGGPVQEAIMIPEEEAALVTFYDAQNVKVLVEKEHIFAKKAISVYRYYPTLDVTMYGRKRPCVMESQGVACPPLEITNTRIESNWDDSLRF